nr:MAG TPA: hypothetical protein [Caudoviricetes sp.]
MSLNIYLIPVINLVIISSSVLQTDSDSLRHIPP